MSPSTPPEIDKETRKASYRSERNERLHPGGKAQSQRLCGRFADYAVDSYLSVEPVRRIGTR